MIKVFKTGRFQIRPQKIPKTEYWGLFADKYTRSSLVWLWWIFILDKRIA